MKLVIGNRRYSSWSLRGWLACKQSGLAFDTVVVPMDTADWARAKADPALMPSGKVPVLWDGDIAVWESLAIIDWLADRIGRDRFWPAGDDASALARSMAAEMHSGFAALRGHCPMNTGRTYPSFKLTADVERDIGRIDALWREALQLSGGPFLFGAFGAADIMYAPVVTRLRTYDIIVSEPSETYAAEIIEQPFVREWYAGAQEEPWRIERVER